ncbi:hypothetical protein CF326_g7868 [Tilletia indica]|nr:hypothetical protein CF326_g7868 [Tilletia indica]
MRWAAVLQAKKAKKEADQAAKAQAKADAKKAAEDKKAAKAKARGDAKARSLTGHRKSVKLDSSSAAAAVAGQPALPPIPQPLLLLASHTHAKKVE